MRSVFLLTLLLAIGSASAQMDGNESTGDPAAEQGGMDVDDDFNYMPFVVLVGVAAVVFAIAKYGP